LILIRAGRKKGETHGTLDAYEDPCQPLDARVDDPIEQMTLEEKAGMLFINGAAVNADGSIEYKPGGPGFAGVAIT
jgi:beta-glucosidase